MNVVSSSVLPALCQICDYVDHLTMNCQVGSPFT